MGLAASLPPVELSILIPVFRARESLAELYARLVAVLEQRQVTFELVFVEDAGRDGSWLELQRIAARDGRVRAFRMSRNYGQHNAILCALRQARGRVSITMDDDLQHPPEELPKLLDALTGDLDVVYGPPSHEQHGLFRNLASRVTKVALQEVMGAAVASKVSALRIFHTDLRDAFSEFRGPVVNIDVLLTWATNRFGVVSVRHDARKFGASGYTARHLVRHAMNMMTGFSVMPLKVSSIIGLGAAGFGCAVLAYVLVRYLVLGGSVPGFPFLASIVSIFSGAQLLALGIIGEYLSRMHLRTMERPSYFVREQSGEAA